MTSLSCILQGDRPTLTTVSSTLTTAQLNQGVVPGIITTFDNLQFMFDLDKSLPCPESGKVQFCVVIDKGDPSQGLNPDFSIDDDSETEECKELDCRGMEQLGLHYSSTPCPPPLFF